MTTMVPSGLFTTFSVGEYLFGVPSVGVREILRDAAVTAVPLVSAALRGVFNVRGELVTAVDLGVRLGLHVAGQNAAVHVLFPTADGTMSLLVDSAGDVVDVGAARLEAPPGGLTGAARDCVMGAYKLPGRLLIVLDARKTLDLGTDADGVDSIPMTGGT